MARALFCTVPHAASISGILLHLKRHGFRADHVSTLTLSAPDQGRAPYSAIEGIHSTGQLKWAMQGMSRTTATRRIARVLEGMGMPSNAARHYQDLVRRGDTLICVFCEDFTQARDAKLVLQQSGARELASTGAPDPSANASLTRRSLSGQPSNSSREL